MDKKQVLPIVEWGIALAACGYLAYRLVVFDDYASLWASLRSMGRSEALALALCVALMPVNMSLEAWRWKTLLPMSWREAHRQVYYSKLAGVITPWRLGEYPARAMLQGEWKQTLSMGALASATMTIAIIMAGVAGAAFSPAILPYVGGSYLYALCAVIAVLAIVFALAPALLRKWAQVNHGLMLRSIGQSLIRLSCWCLQLALVLYALGAIYNLQFTIYNLPVYYLLVTITPNVPIAEVGVRGAWAVVLFGSVNAALAGVLLWTINTLFPCLIWPFMAKKKPI